MKERKEATGVIVPRDFVRTLLEVVRDCDDDWYEPRQQADAAECLHYILDAIHESVYRTVNITIQGVARNKEEESKLASMKAWSAFFQKEYSPVVEHFYGQHQLKVTCETCGTVSERYEPWSMLKLPIPGGETPGSPVPNLTDCLNAFYASEQVEDYQCDTCKGKRVATLQTRISKLPNILILVFKRFTNSGLKIRGAIDWDADSVSFQPWSAFRSCPYAKSTMISKFQTFAVIEHFGSARSGHYHMFRRESGDWMDYDDSSVGVYGGSVVTPDSYILFLRPG
jgi:ubiquitin C-terminal hydrolase